MGCLIFAYSIDITIHRVNRSSRFSRNSKAFDFRFPDNLDRMSPSFPVCKGLHMCENKSYILANYMCRIKGLY